jgi:hypothetical protein
VPLLSDATAPALARSAFTNAGGGWNGLQGDLPPPVG